jgi:hypothetical protein
MTMKRYQNAKGVVRGKSCRVIRYLPLMEHQLFRRAAVVVAEVSLDQLVHSVTPLQHAIGHVSGANSE